MAKRRVNKNLVAFLTAAGIVLAVIVVAIGTINKARRDPAAIAAKAAAQEQAGDLRRELVDKLLERDLPKIKQVLAENEGAAAEEIEKALKEIGIGEAVILRMQEKGGLLENLGKKKKRRFF